MSGQAVLYAFLLGFVATLALVPLAKKIAIYAGALDKPNARKVHQVPIPLWGGLGIFGGFAVSALTVWYFCPALAQSASPGLSRIFFGMLVSAAAMVVVGLIDDRYNMPAKVKLLCQLVIGTVMICCGIRIDYITVPFYGVVFLSTWQVVAVTLFWIAGITNALNLLDGLDGLLAGVSCTTALVFLVVSLMRGQYVTAMVMASLAGCALGFLRYNFNPAQIFMGDTGSLFFGLMFAGWSVVGLLKSTATFAFFVPVLLMAVPIFDTSFAIVRRLIARRPIFQPDKGHLHHRLLGLGLSQKQVVLLIYAINTAFGLVGLALFYLTNRGV